ASTPTLRRYRRAVKRTTVAEWPRRRVVLLPTQWTIGFAPRRSARTRAARIPGERRPRSVSPTTCAGPDVIIPAAASSVADTRVRAGAPRRGGAARVRVAG